MSKVQLDQIFKFLVPTNLYESPDYQELLYPISLIYQDIDDLVSRFPELSDVDNVEELFLPKLSALIGYDYRYNISSKDQREIIKNILKVYRDRGSDDSIVMATTYGDDTEWVGGHLFVPGASINRTKAWVEHPIDNVFILNESELSSDAKLQDASRYRAGTIVIHSGVWNDTIRKAVRKVIPAGTKIYYNLDAESSLIVEFGEWIKVTAEYLLKYYNCIQSYISNIMILDDNERTLSGNQLLEGEIEITPSYLLEYYTASTYYPISMLLPHDVVASPEPDQIDKILSHGTQQLEYTNLYLTSNITMKVSDNDTPLDMIRPLSGIWTGEFPALNIIKISECLPDDFSYNVVLVKSDTTPKSYNDFNRVLSSLIASKDNMITIVLGSSSFPVSQLTTTDYKSNISSGDDLNSIINHTLPSNIEYSGINSTKYLGSMISNDTSAVLDGQYVLSGLPDI